MNYRKDIYEKVKFMLKENPDANINCSKLARIYGYDRRTVSKNIGIVKNNIPPPKSKRAKKTDGFEQIIEEKVKTGASLTKMLEVLPNVMDNSAKNKIPLADSLLELTNAEIEFRAERAKKVNITISHFPYIKTFKNFDFSYKPSIKREQIADLMTLRFIETKTNIVFVGTNGVGKTHLATAIGIEAASQRISTYFINFAKLMEKFKQATKENRVEQVVKHYLQIHSSDNR